MYNLFLLLIHLIQILDNGTIYTPDVNTKGRDVNSILSEIMHSDIRPPEITAKLNAFAKAIDDEYLEKSQIILDELTLELGENGSDLCAYCTSRLNDNHNEVKIEHYQPRNNDNELDYNNLLAVCPGNSTNNEPCRQHCDTKKGNTKLHIDPQQVAHIKQISYDSIGTIIAKK